MSGDADAIGLKVINVEDLPSLFGSPAYAVIAEVGPYIQRSTYVTNAQPSFNHLFVFTSLYQMGYDEITLRLIQRDFASGNEMEVLWHISPYFHHKFCYL